MRTSSKQRKPRGYSLVRLDLSAALKRRIAAVARGIGQSPHEFMLQAIERKTRLAERRKHSRG